MEWALSFCDDDVVRLRSLKVSRPPLPPPNPAVVAPGDERALILAATERLVGREGYATLTVPRIRAVAGVSRRSFDTHFEGVRVSFLATLGTLSDRTLATAAPFDFTADDWAAGVHRMIVDLCRRLAHDHAFAGLAFLEVFSPGSEAIHWRSEMIVKLAMRLRRGAPSAQRPSQFAAEASIGAMWGVIHHFVATGRAARLPLAAPVLSYLALAPALGGAATIDAIASGVDRGVAHHLPAERVGPR